MKALILKQNASLELFGECTSTFAFVVYRAYIVDHSALQQGVDNHLHDFYIARLHRVHENGIVVGVTVVKVDRRLQMPCVNLKAINTYKRQQFAQHESVAHLTGEQQGVATALVVVWHIDVNAKRSERILKRQERELASTLSSFLPKRPSPECARAQVPTRKCHRWSDVARTGSHWCCSSRRDTLLRATCTAPLVEDCTLVIR